MMDPDATFRDIIEAVEAGDENRVTELADALNNWLSRGGFPPVSLGRRELGTVWHTAVTKAAIRLAKSHVRIVASRKGGT